MKRRYSGTITGFPGDISDPAHEPVWEGCRRTGDIIVEHGLPSEGWEKATYKVLEDIGNVLHLKAQTDLKFAVLDARIKNIETKISQNTNQCSVLVPIQALTSESVQLLKPFNVVVQGEADEYIATFFDANVNASGETPEEAVANLKDVLIGTFENLSNIADKLGLESSRRLAVLKQFIRLAKECESLPKNTP